MASSDESPESRESPEPGRTLGRTPPPMPPAVARVFDGFSAPVRARLLELRELVYATAEATPGVGPIDEPLKWGQPAYLTAETGSGTTIRLGPAKARADRCCLFVHCQTSLVERLRAEHGDRFEFEGTRAVLFDVDRALPPETAAIVAAALTYHRRSPLAAARG